jgi:drug/metabolite transporter (DMT)-like permease
VNSRRLAANAGAFVAAVLFGSSVVAVRVVVQEVPPLSLAVLRFGEAALLLVFVLMIFRGRELLSVKWRDLPLLVLLGIVLFAVFPVTFNASLRLIEASRGPCCWQPYPCGARCWLELPAANDCRLGK